MATKLYVGGLPYSTTEDQLREAFERFGEVESAVIIIDRQMNRSKGFGFVEMKNGDDAKKAEQEMNGADFGGRTLTVNEARPMEERPARPAFRGNDRRDGGNFGGGYGRSQGGRW